MKLQKRVFIFLLVLLQTLLLNGQAEVEKGSESSVVEVTTEVKFMYYNLRNYLQMKRGSEVAPKPEEEIVDLISNIKRVNPEILAVCEIGVEKDLEDLKRRLKEVGVDLPFTVLVRGSDFTRRQAILSKYPIENHPFAKQVYKMKGEEFQVRRGILDVSIITPKGKFRFLGAHLKSKRPMKDFDHNIVRRNEALIMRNHITKLLTENAERLIVYGDLNDTKRSQAVRTIKGPFRGKLSIQPIDLRAKDGTRWTHYWNYEDIYARIDYVMTSQAAWHHVDSERSYVLDVPRDDQGSDHRALVVFLK